MSQQPNSTTHLYDKVEIAGKNVDPVTGSVGVIDINHLAAHLGLAFHSSGKVPAVAIGGELDFYMEVPADLAPHWSRVLLNFGDGDIDVTTFENTIVSAVGTEIPSYCTNRVDKNVAGLKLYSGATITDIGDPLHTLWAPPTASQGAHVVGISDITNGEEWIMAPSTGYAIRIKNNSGSIITMSWEMLWLDLPLGGI